MCFLKDENYYLPNNLFFILKRRTSISVFANIGIKTKIRKSTTGFPVKWRLRTHASLPRSWCCFWLANDARQIRNTSKVSVRVVTRHWCKLSALVSQTSITSGGVTKFRLFSLIFSPPLQNFMLFLQKIMTPLLFLSRSSSFSYWASLACRPSFTFSLSFSSPSIFQIFGHNN